MGTSNWSDHEDAMFALFAALASTAYFALRRSRYLSTAATACAVLLIADAWFDVMTTPGNWQAVRPRGR